MEFSDLILSLVEWKHVQLGSKDTKGMIILGTNILWNAGSIVHTTEFFLNFSPSYLGGFQLNESLAYIFMLTAFIGIKRNCSNSCM